MFSWFVLSPSDHKISYQASSDLRWESSFEQAPQWGRLNRKLVFAHQVFPLFSTYSTVFVFKVFVRDSIHRTSWRLGRRRRKKSAVLSKSGKHESSPMSKRARLSRCFDDDQNAMMLPLQLTGTSSCSLFPCCHPVLCSCFVRPSHMQSRRDFMQVHITPALRVIKILLLHPQHLFFPCRLRRRIHLHSGSICRCI